MNGVDGSLRDSAPDHPERPARPGATPQAGAPTVGDERMSDPSSRRETSVGRGVQVRAGDTPASARGQFPRPLVVKLGGRALDAPGALSECAAALREAGSSGPSARALLVVHGGGAEVTAWCARLGVEARFADGLRVTDASTLEIAAAVLAGLANKRLVAALRARGLDAVGLSALDNLVKGAAGQAVQNWNAVHGWDEGLGLSDLRGFFP